MADDVEQVAISGIAAGIIDQMRPIVQECAKEIAFGEENLEDVEVDIWNKIIDQIKEPLGQPDGAVATEPLLSYRIQVQVHPDDINKYEELKGEPENREEAILREFDRALREGEVWQDCFWITKPCTLSYAKQALERASKTHALSKYRLVLMTEI